MHILAFSESTLSCIDHLNNSLYLYNSLKTKHFQQCGVFVSIFESIFAPGLFLCHIISVWDYFTSLLTLSFEPFYCTIFKPL